MSFCPDSMVIGAQKPGTATLHAPLGHHPELKMSEGKELELVTVENQPIVRNDTR